MSIILNSRIWFILVVFIFVSTISIRATTSSSSYGVFTLETGNGYIVRDNKKINVDLGVETVVYNNDLIRLTGNSLGMLKSKEKASVELGSNAVLKVKSWEEANSKGFLSLLYGKIKATIAGLSPSENFNIRTANSVIGVKGTEYSAGVNEEGNSFAWALDKYVYFTDAIRKNQMVVPTGYYSANIKGSGLQRMVYVGKESNIKDIASSAIGSRSTVSTTDSFFKEQNNIGSLPVLDVLQASAPTDRALIEQKELLKGILIPVNFGNTINSIQ